KKLYFDLYRPELRPAVSAEQQRLFDSGHEIGALAQAVFAGGKDASPQTPGDFMSWLESTQEFLTAGIPVIYEAAFSADGVFAAMDILAHVNGERWTMEVKSSTTVKDYHLDDAAFQYHVMKLAGWAPDKVFIMHIDNTYVRHGAIDPNGLLKRTDITAEVLALQDKVSATLAELKENLSGGTEPTIPIGPHCDAPFECSYKHHCWKHVPEQSVFNLLSARGRDWELYEDGIVEMVHIPDYYALTPKQRVQVETTKSGQPWVDTKAIAHFFSQWQFPLYFFDFETILPVIPVLAGTSPFEQVPFQYSLHIVNEQGEVQHREFLAPHDNFQSGTDPRKLLVEQMKRDFGSQGSIVAYNSTFEMEVLKRLAKTFPEDAGFINGLLARFQDLWVVFRSGWYYHPKMQSSTSIKAVLPAVTQSFDYSDLSISNGGMATTAFLDLILGKNLEKAPETRQALLRYCHRDTEAMVEIWRALRGI
ncbi:MAG: DUF2779 domain-containing protein, partial [Bacteroidota bacterium]